MITGGGVGGEGDDGMVPAGAEANGDADRARHSDQLGPLLSRKSCKNRLRTLEGACTPVLAAERAATSPRSLEVKKKEVTATQVSPIASAERAIRRGRAAPAPCFPAQPPSSTRLARDP